MAENIENKASQLYMGKTLVLMRLLDLIKRSLI